MAEAVASAPVQPSPLTRLGAARPIALLLPAALLAGAFGSQYFGRLYPCEMCWWQRYPHFAAVALALVSFAMRPKPLWVGLAALAILGSGLIGAFHAGVEYGWWQGVTACSRPIDATGGDALEAIMNTPLVRCDVPQWTLAGAPAACS